MKEEEIRKRNVFNKYLKLVEKDIKNFFKINNFVDINCPACNCSDFIFEFKKMGFTYVSCKKCSTLYVNPRPSFKDLKNFYTNSPSMNFWIKKFFMSVAESRRINIFRPRAEYINKNLPKKSNGLIGDIGAGFGIFLEELSKYWPNAKLIAIEPSPEQAEICRSKGIDTQCCTLEDLKGFKGQFDLLTAFELFEHLSDPSQFLRKIWELLRPTGHFLLTTLSGKGFDIQILWEKSKSISPPHHLNFFNPNSLVILLRKNDFIVEEISTPGQLDWDIVEGMILIENIKVDRFWQLLAKSKKEEAKEALQDWIKKYQFSSHVQVLAKKR